MVRLLHTQIETRGKKMQQRSVGWKVYDTLIVRIAECNGKGREKRDKMGSIH
jgi:hypothetical protein